MKRQGQFILRVCSYTVFIFIIITSLLHADDTTESVDNSESLASIDRDIAAKKGRYRKGLVIYNGLESKLDGLHRSATSMLEAEMAMNDLVDNQRRVYQNNALKIQGSLGLSIAMLGPTALMPAKTITEGAITAFSMFIVDPIMGEAGNWMGVGNPMASNKDKNDVYANGTFPSQHRIEFWLNETPTDNADILERGRQIISFAEQGRGEVRSIRIEIMSTYKTAKGIRESLKASLESLNNEIEVLQRHRKVTAGETEEGEPPIVVAIPDEIDGAKKSDAGNGYKTPDRSPEALAVLNSLLARIAALDPEINDAEKKLFPKIKEIVDYPPTAIQQMRINHEKRKDQSYENSRWIPVITLNELKKNCGSYLKASYNQGISGAGQLHDAYVGYMTAYIQDMNGVVTVYENAANELEKIPEIKLLQELYGIRASLVDRFSAILRPWSGRFDFRHFSDEAGHRRSRLGYVNEARQKMVREQQFWLREVSHEQSSLDALRDFSETRWQLVGMARTCVENTESAVGYQLRQAQLGLRARQKYFAASDKLRSYFKSLVSQKILIATPNGSGGTGYAVSDEWLAAQLEGTDGGACLGVEKILQALSIPAKRVELLRDNAKSARENALASSTEIGSSNIIKYNLPGVHSRIMAFLARKKTASQDKWNRAEAITYYERSNLPWIVDRLEGGRLDMFRKSLPLVTLAEIQKKETVGQNSLLLSFLVIVQSSQSSARISSTAIGEYKKMLKDYKKRYAMHLGCLGDDHIYNRKIVELFAAIEKAIKKLRGKPTFLDAGEQIAALEILKDTAINLSLGDDKQYKKQVEDLRVAYLANNDWLEENKPQMSGTQARKMTKLLREIQQTFSAHREHLLSLSADDDVEKIIAFYDAFKNAYESKNESLVMSYIDDEWSSADGVTLLDLEDNLRNMYTVFDDIQYSISGLSVGKSADNFYEISYSVTIIGTIFDNDLTHKEVSAVTERVIINSSGQPKIYRTLGGSYWSIN